MEIGTHRLRDLRLRDPFVLPAAGEGWYYLYGSTDPNTWFGPGTGFDAYRSRDLERWEGPFRVFTPPEGFWGTENFWAPEVHEVAGRLFMFATFRGAAGRGTAVLAADAPLGPFLPHSDGAVTPRGQDALDGTLFADQEGGLWLVYCHEWHQSVDGSVCALRLSRDLRGAAGEPATLFTASQAPWTVPIKEGYHAADGPFLHRAEDGALFMLWSSFGAFGYGQGVAVSSGGLLGPWRHRPIPIWEADGGHGMTFRSFEGALKMTLHHPNQTGYERALVLDVEESAGGLALRRPGAQPGVVLRTFNRGGSRRAKLRFLASFLSRRVFGRSGSGSV